MQPSIDEIEYRLRKACVPEPQIRSHLEKVTQWRKEHPRKIRRHRWFDGWNDVERSDGKRRYVGTRAVFSKRGH